jgi:hypothetical protein
MAKYAVIDDYGDNWEEGSIAFECKTLAEAEMWAEGENFHSASIVKIVRGERVLVK